MYGVKNITVCNRCNADISGAVDDHMSAHFIFDGVSYSYYAEERQVQTGTNKTTIPEQGHYEQVWVEG